MQYIVPVRLKERQTFNYTPMANQVVVFNVKKANGNIDVVQATSTNALHLICTDVLVADADGRFPAIVKEWVKSQLMEVREDAKEG